MISWLHGLLSNRSHELHLQLLHQAKAPSKGRIGLSFDSPNRICSSPVTSSLSQGKLTLKNHGCHCAVSRMYGLPVLPAAPPRDHPGPACAAKTCPAHHPSKAHHPPKTCQTTCPGPRAPCPSPSPASQAKCRGPNHMAQHSKHARLWCGSASRAIHAHAWQG